MYTNIYLREFHQVTRVYATTQKSLNIQLYVLSKSIVSEKKKSKFKSSTYINEIQKYNNI